MDRQEARGGMAGSLFCGAVARAALFSFHGANNWQTNKSFAQRQKET